MSPTRRDVLETGIDILDRKLGGGIPLGSVVAFSASPASQSELFLYEVASTRQTVYLSTVRPRETVEETLEHRDIDLGAVKTVALDSDAPLDHAREVLTTLPAESNFIVDPVGILEECEGARYRQFLADLERRAGESDSVVLLHCLSDATTRQRCDTLHVADLVFELSTEVDGNSVGNQLTIPKFRAGQSVEDVIKLDLTSEVEVDMSRNIV